MNPPHRLRLFSDKMRRRAKLVTKVYGGKSDGVAIANLIDKMADVCTAAVRHVRDEEKASPLSMSLLRLIAELDKVTKSPKKAK